MASRMAARSTTAGTPVKSCISTRAGRNAISAVGAPVPEPCGHGANVFGCHGLAVFVAQKVLKKNLERERQPRHAVEAILFRFRKAEVLVRARADLQGAAAIETV